MLELDFCLFIQQTLREHLQCPDLYNGMHKTDKAEKDINSLCSQEASSLVGDTDNQTMRKARVACDEKERIMCSEWGQAVSISDPVAISTHSQYSTTLLTFYQRSSRLFYCCDTVSDIHGEKVYPTSSFWMLPFMIGWLTLLFWAHGEANTS